MDFLGIKNGGFGNGNRLLGGKNREIWGAWNLGQKDPDVPGGEICLHSRWRCPHSRWRCPYSRWRRPYQRNGYQRVLCPHQDGASGFTPFRRLFALIGQSLPTLNLIGCTADVGVASQQPSSAMAGGVSGVREGNGEKRGGKKEKKTQFWGSRG